MRHSPEAPAPKRPVQVIKPRKGWVLARPRELWEFRELLLRFAARDITLRYRQTALGVTWVVLQPLLGAGILSFVFGNVANLPAPAGVPYFAFSLTGMVIWTAFNQTVLRASASLVANANMVQKVFFPRLLLPVSMALSTMVDVAVSLALVAGVIALSGVAPGAALATFPLWMALAVAAGLGIALMASALMVRYRDVQYIVPAGIQLLLFLSPVAYSLAAVPSGSRPFYELNPLAGLLEGFRWSLLDTGAPSVGLTIYAAAVSVGLLLVGVLVFHRMEKGFADVI